jgi:hypothetical protein
METYLQLNNAADDERTVLHVSTFLVRDAELWWRRHCQDYVTHSMFRIKTWTQLAQALRQNFKPVNLEMKARDKLAELRQVASVRNYTAEFRKLALDIPSMPSHEFLDKFIRGLKPHIKVDIKKAQALGLCRTLKDTLQMAERMDSIREPATKTAFYSHREVKGFGNKKDTLNPRIHAIPSSKTGTFTPRKNYVPMSPQERIKLIAEKKCFFCKEPGHMFPDCPKRKKVNAVDVQVDQGQSSQGN